MKSIFKDRHKRLKLSIFVLLLNFITFWIGIYKGVDLSALGAGLALICTPLYGYLFGETIKPSKPTEQKNEDV